MVAIGLLTWAILIRVSIWMKPMYESVKCVGYF